MLGERIANLRKEKKVSQEELADVLMTSRQAISKWERGESIPDIDRLKDLAIYFNVSIDYLLDYDVEATSINTFIDRLKKGIENKKFDITVDEIRVIVSKNVNNFVLISYVLTYLNAYYTAIKKEEIAYLVIEYCQRAIALYQPNNPLNVSINDIHKCAASCYFSLGKYDLAKAYLKDNKVYNASELLAGCEFELGNYREAERITSEIFMGGIGSTINGASQQIRIHLRNYNYVEALELSSWVIDFLLSIGKSDEVFVDMLFIFVFVKACCKKVLGHTYEEEYDYLKENVKKIAGYRDLGNGIRFYKDQDVVFTTSSGDIKGDLLKEIEHLKNDKLAYAKTKELYIDVFGGD